MTNSSKQKQRRHTPGIKKENIGASVDPYIKGLLSQIVRKTRSKTSWVVSRLIEDEAGRLGLK